MLKPKIRPNIPLRKETKGHIIGILGNPSMVTNGWYFQTSTNTTAPPFINQYWTTSNASNYFSFRGFAQ